MTVTFAIFLLGVVAGLCLAIVIGCIYRLYELYQDCK